VYVIENFYIVGTFADGESRGCS